MDTPIFPPMIQVETMNKCNLRCTMCPITIGQTNRPEMEFKLFEKIVKECQEYNRYLHQFGLFLLNEPLLDRTLPEKIALAKKYGIKNTYIATNAELLDEKKILSLFESGLDRIILSIESLNPRIHEKFRVGSNLSIIKKNVDRLFELKKEHSRILPRVIVRMLAFEENKNERKEFIKYWLEKGADAVSINKMHNWGGQINEINPELVGRNVCTQLWDMMVIQSDGNVCLCCLDSNGDYKLGNIKSESIYEIWHGDKFEKIRKEFEEKNIKKCINCNWTPYDVEGKWFQKTEIEKIEI